MEQYICDRCGAIIPLYSNYHHVIFYDQGVTFSNIDCLKYLHNMNQAFMENYELVVKE